jgi:hypothetical protein
MSSPLGRVIRFPARHFSMAHVYHAFAISRRARINTGTPFDWLPLSGLGVN